MCYSITLLRNNIRFLLGFFMKHNLGKTKMRTRRRLSNNLHEFDCLPRELREWLRDASLPWSTSSAKRIYNRVLSTSGDSISAIVELNRLEKKQLTKYKVT